MIRIYTKLRHVQKIADFLTTKKLEHEIFTINDVPSDTTFDLGVSYCYPRKISNELLNIPKIAFVNYHPGPLPDYKCPTEYEDAIEKVKDLGGDGGVIVLDKNGDVSMDFNTAGMYRAYINNEGELTVKIYND